MPFSKGIIDFLLENRLRDSRAWFDEHREVYRRDVFEPLRALTVALTPVMLEIDALLTTEPRVDRTICRIRRDTRYSRDKSLYRDTMWIIFKRGKMHGAAVPGLYFEITGGGFNYGTGFYDASAGYMETMRDLILKGDPAFVKARRAFEGQSLFQMEGTCYKRPRFAGRPEALRTWLERRNISFSAESADFDLLFSDRLADKLAGDFRLLAPVYRFLLRAALQEQENEAARAALSSGR